MPTSKLTPADLNEILSFTTKLARKAGALIIEGSVAIQSAFSKDSDVNEKKNSVDLVTEYDVRVEELVKKELKTQYPTFQFIGEESYSAGHRPPLTDEPTFCVDPIGAVGWLSILDVPELFTDGTTNFIHGFPFVCISLGLIYERRPILGVIYNPFLNHMYTGVKGQGSFLIPGLDLEPLRLPLAPPKALPSLSQALIGNYEPSFLGALAYSLTTSGEPLAVEWGSDRTLDTINAKTGSFSRLAGNSAQGVVGGKMVHSLRSIGSAALNYGMVAGGGLDLYWEIGCWPWDVCAGIVIAEEAGCVVTGSHDTFATSSSSENFGIVTEEILTGRKYVVVRAIGDSKDETGSAAQKRIIKEFYETVEDVAAN